MKTVYRFKGKKKIYYSYEQIMYAAGNYPHRKDKEIEYLVLTQISPDDIVA